MIGTRFDFGWNTSIPGLKLHKFRKDWRIVIAIGDRSATRSSRHGDARNASITLLYSSQCLFNQCWIIPNDGQPSVPDRSELGYLDLQHSASTCKSHRCGRRCDWSLPHAKQRELQEQLYKSSLRCLLLLLLRRVWRLPMDAQQYDTDFCISSPSSFPFSLYTSAAEC